MSAHTPGPWVVAELTLYNPGQERCVRDSRGMLVACAQRPDSDNDITAAVRDANARLIASAPELFEACRALFAAEQIVVDVETQMRASRTLRSVINKIDGR